MFIRDSKFEPFQRTSGLFNSIFYGNKIDVQVNILISINVSFLPLMTFLKHGFQSLILQTVNFRSLLNCVHLPKIYAALHFMDSIQLLN